MARSLLLSQSSLKMRDEKKKSRCTEVRRPQRVTVQRGAATYSQKCRLCETYCSSEAALCSEKSSRQLCGGWWTVSLWTTGSPLYSVPASRSATRIFCSLVSARGKQHCLSLLPSSPEPAEHSGRFWVCFGVPWGYTSLKIQINLLCLLFKNFLHFIR